MHSHYSIETNMLPSLVLAVRAHTDAAYQGYALKIAPLIITTSILLTHIKNYLSLFLCHVHKFSSFNLPYIDSFLNTHLALYSGAQMSTTQVASYRHPACGPAQ